MEKIKVAVLFGGQSTEHAVSLQSACAVLHAMKGTRFEAVPVGITREGRWFWYRGPLDAVGEGVWEKEECAPVTLTPDASVHGLLVQGAGSLYLDAAFPVLHGKNGEDGTVQGLLALAGIPCVGCGVLASALCMDKDAAHRLARAAGVEVPPCAVLHAPPRPEVLAACTHGLRYPLFVKPACAGSSFGVTRVETPDALPAAVAEAFRHDGKVLVEQAVPGFEVGCAVLGAGEALTVGEVDEIELAHGFFDYTEKYTLETARIHMPARLSLAERDRVREAAKTVYRALCCTGFARVDLFYTPDGRIVFNEVNTIPGFTEHSRFPGMMRGAGVEFGPLVERLLEQAVAGTLALVNPAHPLQARPAPEALVPAMPDAPGVLLARQAAVMLAALLDGIRAAGRIVPVSGWRSHAEQQALYADSVRDNGLEFTQKYVALPGCSEHETGLAIDVGEAREVIDFIRPAFPDTGVCAAFRRAAARYGFIERYPKGAQTVTGIGHEPWHFRYVGWPHAGLMAQRGVTLEEYIGALGAYTPEQPLHAEAGGRGFDIFRVPLGPEGARFDAPRDRVWQASADNCGGLVVTVWGAV